MFNPRETKQETTPLRSRKWTTKNY
jgi:hypothetical protein